MIVGFWSRRFFPNGSFVGWGGMGTRGACVRLVESIAEGGSPLIRYAKKFEKEKKLLSVETVSGLNQRWRCGDVEMWR